MVKKRNKVSGFWEILIIFPKNIQFFCFNDANRLQNTPFWQNVPSFWWFWYGSGCFGWLLLNGCGGYDALPRTACRFLYGNSCLPKPTATDQIPAANGTPRPRYRLARMCTRCNCACA